MSTSSPNKTPTRSRNGTTSLVAQTPSTNSKAATPASRPGKPIFVSQSSLLDLDRIGTEEGGVMSSLWGFVNVFWLAVAWYGIRSIWYNWTVTGTLLDWRLAKDLGVDVVHLFLADFAMILSTFFVLPLEIAQVRGWISRRTGLFVQHAYQTAFFFYWTLYIWYNDW